MQFGPFQDKIKSNEEVFLYWLVTWSVSLGYSFFQITIIPFFLTRGMNFLEIGFLFSIYWFVIFIVNIPTGVLADLYGRSNLFAFGTALQAIAFIGFAWSETFSGILVCQILWAVGVAMQSDTLEAWIAEVIREQNKTGFLERIFYVSNIGTQILFAFGGIFGTYLFSHSVGLPWIFSAWLLGVSAVLAFVFLRKKKFVKATLSEGDRNLFCNLRKGLKYSLTTGPLLWMMMVYVLVLFAFQGPNTQWQTFFGQYLSMSVKDLSWLWLVIVFGTGSGSLIASKLLGAYSNRTKIMVGFLFMLIPLVVVGKLLGGFYLVAAFWIHEAGRGIFSPAFSAAFNNYIDNPLRSTVLSVLSSIAICGASLGSFICGWIAKHLDILSTWIICGGVLSLAFVIYFVTSPSNRSLSPSEVSE